LVLICFFREQNALWAETGEDNIDMLVLMLYCMDFSSVNQLSYLKSENQLVCMLFRCRTEKIWEKETLKLKSTDMWMSKVSEDMWVIMSYNLHAGSMKQSRHNILKQNPGFMKNSAKKCRPLCLPSQHGMDNKWDERVSKCL
jgi:hypothetical protein